MLRKRLKVDLDEVVQAMDDFTRDINDYYLDRQTGKVECVPVHMLEELEVDGKIDEDDLPEWEREFVPFARAIAAEDPRYSRVPESDSHEAYRLMQDFIGEVEDEETSRRLWRAIDGRGAFRMFKDTLYDYPKLRERWFEFEAKRKREWAREWLEELDMELEKGNATSG
jgi:hypothetical protein